MSEYLASFVVFGGEVEFSRPGERVTHAELAARLRVRTGVTAAAFVSGVLTVDRHGALARVGPLDGVASAEQVERLVTAHGEVPEPVEFSFSA